MQQTKLIDCIERLKKTHYSWFDLLVISLFAGLITALNSWLSRGHHHNYINFLTGMWFPFVLMAVYFYVTNLREKLLRTPLLEKIFFIPKKKVKVEGETLSFFSAMAGIFKWFGLVVIIASPAGSPIRMEPVKLTGHQELHMMAKERAKASLNELERTPASKEEYIKEKANTILVDLKEETHALEKQKHELLVSYRWFMFSIFFSSGFILLLLGGFLEKMFEKIPLKNS